MSQPVQACEPGLGDLSKATAPAYFFVIKVMFVGVMNLGQIQKLRFVGVKNFRSCSTTTFGYLHLVMLITLKVVSKQDKIHHFNKLKKLFRIFFNTNNKWLRPIWTPLPMLLKFPLLGFISCKYNVYLRKKDVKVNDQRLQRFSKEV